jgi:2-oxoglutarate dehydrogenase E2 component (dihydrolipoamide succinyltransferase)
MFEIKVPPFGESIQEVQVAKWLKAPGDWVERDEEIVELESEKASQALTAERAGRMGDIKVPQGAFAHIGDTLCLLDDAAAKVGAVATVGSAAVSGGTTRPSEQDAAEARDPASWIMPAAERVLSEYQISADAITPTGPGGRLLKEDVLNYVQKKGLTPVSTGNFASGSPQAAIRPSTAQVSPPLSGTHSSSPVMVPATPTTPAFPAPATPITGSSSSHSQPDKSKHPEKPSSAVLTMPSSPTAMNGHREEQAVPMSMIRRTIAKRLVEAQQTMALLTTFNEIDMHPVKELRNKYQTAFQEKHGVKLGFMSFFAKAAVEGLRRFPAINAEIRGNDVVMRNYHDIGIAIGGGKGLVVPVLRNVERLSFADVERTIGYFGQLAQQNKIQPDDLSGGTFTISNGGVYGSLLSTPIVNPPQSGILGLHAIQDRPIAFNGQVVIRPMMYIALTYDHRVVDGREAVGFLKTIKEVLEEPARLFLEV